MNDAHEWRQIIHLLPFVRVPRLHAYSCVRCGATIQRSFTKHRFDFGAWLESMP
jgi:hypothetical protein